MTLSPASSVLPELPGLFHEIPAHEVRICPRHTSLDLPAGGQGHLPCHAAGVIDWQAGIKQDCLSGGSMTCCLQCMQSEIREVMTTLLSPAGYAKLQSQVTAWLASKHGPQHLDLPQRALVCPAVLHLSRSSCVSCMCVYGSVAGHAMLNAHH